MSEPSDDILRKMWMKYGADIEHVQHLIEHDIKSFGHLSHETRLAKKELKERMLREKTNDPGRD